MAWGYGERKKSMDVPRKCHGMWKRMRATQGEDTLAGCARRDRLQETQDTLKDQGSERTTRVILGLTAQGTHTKTWNERYWESKCGSHFALAIPKETAFSRVQEQAQEPNLYTPAKIEPFRKGSLSERQSGWRNHSKRATVTLRGRGIGVSSETSMVIEQIYMHNLNQKRAFIHFHDPRKTPLEYQQSHHVLYAYMQKGIKPSKQSYHPFHSQEWRFPYQVSTLLPI